MARKISPDKGPGGQNPPADLMIAGKITSVHGVHGWVKIHSFTAPESNIFDYQPWWVKFPDGWRQLETDQFRTVTKGFIAHICGLDDREEARLYCQRDIQVSAAQFPPVEEGEIYWHQLQGLKVISHYDGREYDLGVVDGLVETGANDVVIVKATADSIDDRERLLPYVENFIIAVNLDEGTLIVDWDPEFETRKE